MGTRTVKTRLYVEHPLGAGQMVSLTRDQAHYLFSVMRLSLGDAVGLFNGLDGEWRAQIVEVGKRTGVLQCEAQTADLRKPPDVWLCFAPIKKARTDFIVEKAVELGAARVQPMQTVHTNSERIRRDRLQAHAVEAVEQCGGTFVPEVADLVPMARLLDAWPADRRILFCDETLTETGGNASGIDSLGGSSSFTAVFATLGPADPWAIFIGPEGGFSPAERDRLRAMDQARSIQLGPRILRADTAAVAALTLWQAHLGDWG